MISDSESEDEAPDGGGPEVFAVPQATPDDELVDEQQLSELEDATFDNGRAISAPKHYTLPAERISKKLERQLAELESFMTRPLVLNRMRVLWFAVLVIRWC